MCVVGGVSGMCAVGGVSGMCAVGGVSGMCAVGGVSGMCACCNDVLIRAHSQDIQMTVLWSVGASKLCHLSLPSMEPRQALIMLLLPRPSIQVACVRHVLR
jgi:hypothetical protein